MIYFKQTFDNIISILIVYKDGIVESWVLCVVIIVSDVVKVIPVTTFVIPQVFHIGRPLLSTLLDLWCHQICGL